MVRTARNTLRSSLLRTKPIPRKNTTVPALDDMEGFPCRLRNESGVLLNPLPRIKVGRARISKFPLFIGPPGSAPRPHQPPLLVLREGLEHGEQRAGHAVEVGEALVGRANVDAPLQRATVTIQAPGEPVQLGAPLLGPLDLQRVGPGERWHHLA